MNHALLPKAANANLPATYEAAKYALAECNRIDECKEWSDKAQALASYARQADDKELETTAMRIRARAIRRCGELLKEVEKTSFKGNQHVVTASTGPNRKELAKDAGMSERQAKTAIRVANVPQETFVDQVESNTPPTITRLAEQGKKAAPTKPIFEQQGMTKEEFQAGMYMRGALKTCIREMQKFDPELVVNGCTPKERAELRQSITFIDQYNDKLIAKL